MLWLFYFIIFSICLGLQLIVLSSFCVDQILNVLACFMSRYLSCEIFLSQKIWLDSITKSVLYKVCNLCHLSEFTCVLLFVNPKYE